MARNFTCFIDTKLPPGVVYLDYELNSVLCMLLNHLIYCSLECYLDYCTNLFQNETLAWLSWLCLHHMYVYVLHMTMREFIVCLIIRQMKTDAYFLHLWMNYTYSKEYVSKEHDLSSQYPFKVASIIDMWKRLTTGHMEGDNKLFFSSNPCL